MPAFATTCPSCSCGCGLYLLTSNGRLTGVVPGESHPVSRGKLCARGWAAHEAALWGERLRQPLLRKNGKAEPASWDEAFDQISRRLKELIEAGKSVGVLGSARATNEENYLAGKLARAGLYTNNIDFSYRSLCRSLFEGFEDVCGVPIPTANLNDIASSQAILLLEGNLAETHPRVASLIMEALAKGAFLVTIGYRITQMARLSSIHLVTSPGNEGEVIRSLLAAVLEMRPQDGRLAAVRGKEYEALWRYVEKAERSKELHQTAERIAGGERATFLLACNGGEGAQVRRDTVAFATLAAVTGHLNRRGSVVLPLVARSNVQGACDMGVAPERLPGYERLDDVQARERAQNLWNRKLLPDPGHSTEELLESVSGLIVVADDPPSVLPTGERARAAMDKIEFLAVLDAFVTPTVQKGHVVLPIASFAETDGTVTNMEGRVQRHGAATNPPGNARTGWQVLGELCARFGLGNSYASSNDVLREIGRAAPRYAGIEQRLSEEGWSNALLQDDSAKFVVHPSGAGAKEEQASSPRAWVLVRDGAFDWGRDPLVLFSPTLSRDAQSERKLFPNGFVEMCQRDADALNVSAGRRVRLCSVYGDSVVAIRVCRDLKPGVLSVPYAFRNELAGVLGRTSVTAVSVEAP